MLQLRKIKNSNPEIYFVIKTEVEELIRYGKSIGFL